MPTPLLKNRILSLAVASLALVATALAASAAQATEPTTFSVKVTGQGRPMVLIPGLASAGSVWDSTVAHYASTHECHVLQLAGFAGSPAVPGMSLKQVEEELSAYIASRKLDRPVLVGHSLGGFVALRLAADHPQQPGSVVVVDALPALGRRQHARHHARADESRRRPPARRHAARRCGRPRRRAPPCRRQHGEPAAGRGPGRQLG